MQRPIPASLSDLHSAPIPELQIGLTHLIHPKRSAVIRDVGCVFHHSIILERTRHDISIRRWLRICNCRDSLPVWPWRCHGVIGRISRIWLWTFMEISRLARALRSARLPMKKYAVRRKSCTTNVKFVLRWKRTRGKEVQAQVPQLPQ